MKGIVTGIEEATTKGGKPYVKVSLEDRKYPTVIFDDLKDKWPHLIKGEEVELKMVKDGVDKDGKDRWKCTDIIPVSFSIETELEDMPAAPQQQGRQPENYSQIKPPFSEPTAKDNTITNLSTFSSVCRRYAHMSEEEVPFLKLLEYAQMASKWAKGEIKSAEVK